MPKGGARATSGPPPDPNALRRNRKEDAAGWTALPAEGRNGRTPEFPLTGVQPREWDLWRDLWTRPQAVMWERLHLHMEVALLSRTLAEAEQPGARTEPMKLVRQYMESLGLTAPGLLRLRWRIGPAAEQEEPPAEGPAGEKKAAPARRSARGRLKVVPHGGA